MKKIPLWLKIISVPFAMMIIVFALSGQPGLVIRDAGASGSRVISEGGGALSEILFYVY